jgi:hypothetical protein
MQGVSGALPLAAMAALEESGFVVFPGPLLKSNSTWLQTPTTRKSVPPSEMPSEWGLRRPVSWTSSIAARCSIRCTCIRRYLMPRFGPSA